MVPLGNFQKKITRIFDHISRTIFELSESHKFNNSFHKKDETPSIQSISQVAAVRPTPITTNAAKEIMNHHESRSRLIRDNSCDSITDEVFNNRHRISSASSDNDIHFNIGGDSDDEELTLTPTQQ